MFDWIITAITDFVRSMFWGLIKLVLGLVDAMWYVVRYTITIDIAGNSFVLGVYQMMVLLTGMFIIIKLFFIAYNAFLSNEKLKRLDLLDILRRITIAVFVIAAIPYFYSFATKSMLYFIDNSHMFVGLTVEDANLSDVIMQSSLYDLNFEAHLEDTEFVVIETPDYRTMDINEKSGDTYKYFPGFDNLFLILFVGIASCFLMILITIQIIVRSFSIATKYIIGSWFAAGLVNADDRGFTSWIKHLGSDMALNFLQIVFFYMAIIIANMSSLYSAVPVYIQPIVKSIIFIGLLFAVLMGPSGIASLLGGDGAGTQQIMSAAYQAHALGSTAKAAGQMGTTALAGATYAAGRMLGAPSIKNMNAEQKGSLAQKAASTFSDHSSGNGGLGSSGLSKAYYSEPTEKQKQVLDKAGIDTSGLTRGQASEKIEDLPGYGESFWHGKANDHSTGNESVGLDPSLKDGENPIDKENLSASSSNQQMTNSKRLAAMVEDHASKGGKMANKVYQATHGMYMASASRVARSKLPISGKPKTQAPTPKPKRSSIDSMAVQNMLGGNSGERNQ